MAFRPNTMSTGYPIPPEAQPSNSKRSALHANRADVHASQVVQWLSVETSNRTTDDTGEGLITAMPIEPVPLPQVPGYEILREIGRGGMGIVYLARHLGLNRRVALKMMIDVEFANPEDLLRFRTEAEAVARLRHPNIVQVYEIGAYHPQMGESRPYIALELIIGGSLAQCLLGKPHPPRDAARLIQMLAHAIHHAHLQGVVHRDLKPSNILFNHDQLDTLANVAFTSTQLRDYLDSHQYSLKITDFGLAKFARLQPDTPGHHPRPDATKPGVIIGTPRYMSPEQAYADSTKVGPSSDIYSLGVMLFELITGRPPFDDADPVRLIIKVREKEAPSPRRYVPRVPRDLETICLKCLRKDPSLRYASAGALADDLRRFIQDEPIQARSISDFERLWKWAKKRPAVASLLAMLFSTNLAGFLIMAWLWQMASGVRDVALAAQVEEAKARGVAEQARNEEQQAKSLAERLRQQSEMQKERTELALYASRLQQAQLLLEKHAWQAAQALLYLYPNQARPQRHWEWHYLARWSQPGFKPLTLMPNHRCLQWAISPDHRWLALLWLPRRQQGTSTTGQLQLWNARTWQLINAISIPMGTMDHVALARIVSFCMGYSSIHRPDMWLGLGHTTMVVPSLRFDAASRQLVMAQANGQWQLFSIPELKPINRGKADASIGVNHGEYVVAVDQLKKQISVHRLSNHQTIFSRSFTTNLPKRILLAPYGPILALHCAENKVELWHVTENQLLHQLTIPDLNKEDWHISPSGQWLFHYSRFFPTEMMCIETQRGKISVIPLLAQSGSIEKVITDPLEQHLAIKQSKLLTVWPLPPVTAGRQIHPTSDQWFDVCFQGQEPLLATSGPDRFVQFWDPQTGRCVSTRHSPEPGCQILSAGRSLSWILISTNGSVFINQPQKSEPYQVEYSSPLMESTGAHLLCSSGHVLLPMSSHDQHLWLADGNKGLQFQKTAFRELSWADTNIDQMLASADGQWIVAPSNKKNYFCKWHLDTRERRGIFGPLSGVPQKMALSAHAERLSVYYEHNPIGPYLQVMAQDQIAPLFEMKVPRLAALAISPDGDRLFLVEHSGRFWQINLKTKETVWSHTLEPMQTVKLAMHADGQTVSLWNDAQPNEISIRETEHGQLVQRLSLTGVSGTMTFHPFNQRLAIAKKDGSIALVDCVHGLELLQVHGQQTRHKPIRQLVFSSDGQLLFSTTNDGWLRLWNGSPANLSGP